MKVRRSHGGALAWGAPLMSLPRWRFADAPFAGWRVRRINHTHLDALVEQLLRFCDILREAPIDLAPVGVVQRRVQGRPQTADLLTNLNHSLRDLVHPCPMLCDREAQASVRTYAIALQVKIKTSEVLIAAS
jgi:hypothetical protein